MADLKPTGKARETKPETVLYLHASDDLYGADKILLQLVSSLDPARYLPIVVLPDDMLHVGLLSAELTKRGIEWTHAPLAIVRRRYLRPSGWLRFGGNIIRGTLAVRRIARERKVHLIHGFTLAVAAAPLAAMVLRIPLVMHSHEIIERPRPLRWLLHELGVRWSRRLICVSEATRGNIVADQPKAADRIKVIHNGIEPIEPSGLTLREMRAEMGVPLDKPLVGMIGRISPWKGQPVFLEAAALVAARNPDCHFVSIGGVFDKEVQHQERLERLHRDLGLEGICTLLGFRPDARQLLPAFTMFISPSTSPDPFPTVILEAMSLGVPVIASAHGGPLEMVQDGVTGVHVAPSDAAALAEAIERLLRDPQMGKEMGEAGRDRLKKEFSVDGHMAKLQATYDEVLLDWNSRNC